jgi:hypothetical protein
VSATLLVHRVYGFWRPYKTRPAAWARGAKRIGRGIDTGIDTHADTGIGIGIGRAKLA